MLGYQPTHKNAFSIDLDVGSTMAAIITNIHQSVHFLSLSYVLIPSMMYNGVEYAVHVMFHKGKYYFSPDVNHSKRPTYQIVV